MKKRLDVVLTQNSQVASRSQAENLIKLGKVTVNGQIQNKPGFLVGENDEILVTAKEQYVSRAGLKLESVAEVFKLVFKNKIVLDIGSSTGGFTQFALNNGAKKVIAVDVGTDQMHPTLRGDARIELHEKTDIRDFITKEKIDIILIDVSFISMRQILPAVKKYSNSSTQIAAMLKPQFEASKKDINKGVIKNDNIRRKIIRDFELWLKSNFLITSKADSKVAGAKGNLERFYLLKIIN